MTSSSSSSSSNPHVVHDFKVLKIFSDGSILRTPGPIHSTPIVDDGTSLWKDLPFISNLNLNLRLYIPTTTTTTPNHHLLPILIYFHPGAFLSGTFSWPHYHNCCLRLSSTLNSLVVAFDYRHAPENPLPAALDDAVSALYWLHQHATSVSCCDNWLSKFADFSRVFIFGDSSGGTMAHHLAVKFANSAAELAPLRVKGYILLAPFFAGSERNRSELECREDAFYALKMHDEIVSILVPTGQVDESVLNPFGSLERVVEGEAAVMVVVGKNDLLRDRAVDYGRRLRGLGKKNVEVVEFEGEEHGFFTRSPMSEPATELIQIVGKFIKENNGGPSASLDYHRMYRPS